MLSASTSPNNGHSLATAGALYALARLRFGPVTSAIAAVAVSLLPQYRAAALSPLTDSWGVALEALVLALAVQYCRTGRRALAVAWPVAMLALAFTRDTAALVALALLAVGLRSRRALALGAVGAAAALVPSLWFGAHYPALLAYTLADSHIPPSTSLGWSAHHYWDGVDRMLHGFVSPRRYGVPPMTGIGLAVGLAGLFAVGRGRYRAIVAACAASGLLFILALPQAGFRIALVLVPPAAAGAAALVALCSRKPGLTP